MEKMWTNLKLHAREGLECYRQNLLVHSVEVWKTRMNY